MIKVTTETGSIYEFDYTEMKARRTNETNNFAPMRKDDEWVRLLLKPEITIGEPLRFVISVRDDDVATIRTTSYVTSISDSSEA